MLLKKANLEALQNRMKAATRLLLFVDFDSVLAPGTAADGSGTMLEAEDRDLLRDLSEKNSLTLVLTSNHSLADMKRMIGFTGIYFVANNGMEIFGPDLNVVHAEAKRARREIEPVVERLHRQLKELPGVKLDNRGFSLAVDFSKAKPPIQRRSRLLLEEIWTPLAETFSLHEVQHELIMRPRLGWGKGRAVMFIWNKFASPRRRPFVMYIGSDDNDEEIFSMMGREGMGIVVGGTARAARSKAGYQLKNHAEVKKFIQWLSQHVSSIATPMLSS